MRDQRGTTSHQSAGLLIKPNTDRPPPSPDERQISLTSLLPLHSLLADNNPQHWHLGPSPFPLNKQARLHCAPANRTRRKPAPSLLPFISLLPLSENQHSHPPASRLIPQRNDNPKPDCGAVDDPVTRRLPARGIRRGMSHCGKNKRVSPVPVTAWSAVMSRSCLST